jgi:tetratricopeptide (TPR) repeat protein
MGSNDQVLPAYFVNPFRLGMVLINYLLLLLIVVLATIVHEIGHAAAGFVLGFKIYGITIGRGRVLLKSGALGFPFTIHLNAISGGLALLASPSQRLLRFRWWLMVFAGPAANLAVAGVPYIVPGRTVIKYSASHFSLDQPIPLLLLISVNIVFSIAALIPHRSSRLGGQPSDGYRLITIPFLSEDRFAEYRAAYVQMEAKELVLGQRHSEALELYQQALNANPRSISLVLGLHYVHLKLRNYAEARELLVGLVGRKEIVKGRLRNSVLNNLAWTDALFNDPDLFDEADAYSREVFEKGPRNPYYTGTRGAVLVCMGKLEEGIRLLSKAYRRHRANEARGAVAYWVAIGEARRGAQNEAEKWLKIAVRNCPEDGSRELAEVEIGKLKAAQISM